MQGYNGGPIHFIDEVTICFLAGRNIKFINTETKDQNYHYRDVKSVGLFTVSKEYQVFAYTENSLNPSIHIISFPNFEEKCEISGNCIHVLISHKYSFMSIYMLKIKKNNIS